MGRNQRKKVNQKRKKERANPRSFFVRVPTRCESRCALAHGKHAQAVRFHFFFLDPEAALL